MKKFISLLLCGVLSAGILAGCGKTDNQPTTVPTTGTVTEAPAEETKGSASYESAEALLKAVHAAMKEEFPAAGGDEAHGAEDVGSFDISAYGDSFQAQILVDDSLVEQVKPEAATLLHMMNTNTFCAAAMQLTDAANGESFAESYKTLVQSHHWMCGFPDTVVVLSLGDYILTAYGYDDLIQDFKTAAQSLGANVLVEAPAEA